MITNISNIAHSLKGASFPLTKDELIEHAQSNGAPEEVVNKLKNLESKNFNNMNDVTSGIP